MLCGLRKCVFSLKRTQPENHWQLPVSHAVLQQMKRLLINISLYEKRRKKNEEEKSFDKCKREEAKKALKQRPATAYKMIHIAEDLVLQTVGCIESGGRGQFLSPQQPTHPGGSHEHGCRKQRLLPLLRRKRQRTVPWQ